MVSFIRGPYQKFPKLEKKFPYFFEGAPSLIAPVR